MFSKICGPDVQIWAPVSAMAFSLLQLGTLGQTWLGRRLVYVFLFIFTVTSSVGGASGLVGLKLSLTKSPCGRPSSHNGAIVSIEDRRNSSLSSWTTAAVVVTLGLRHTVAK